MRVLLAEEMLVLFAILALGSWVGRWSFKGVSLGAAGVLFVAMVFGHHHHQVPRPVMELGLLLFVYSVGLQAGPRFFRTFRRTGIRFVVIGLATVLTGLAATIGVARWMRIPFEVASGLFTGALTNTPAMAAAIDVVERSAPGRGALVSVGYGIAYPFSMIGVVLLIQFLPRLLRRRVVDEENRYKGEQAADAPGLLVKQYRVTNPNCRGRLLEEINPHRMSVANISRVRRGREVFIARHDLALELGDVVMAVGSEDELAKLRILLGEETQVPMDLNPDIVTADVEVSDSSVCSKRLAELHVWQQHDVVITRLRRQGLEIVPTGAVTLEMGDSIHLVGEREALEDFSRRVGAGHRADETNMVPFLIGLVLGIGLGALPIPVGHGLTVKLGTAGGAFLVSLVIGHLGRIGPFRLWVPAAARNLSRELGLMLFLAGAGTKAGESFVRVLRTQGPGLFLAGAIITTITVLVAVFLLHRVYRQNLLGTMGALSACMTNPPALGAAAAQTTTDLPALAYASVYPVALIFKIVLAQVLVEVLRRLC